MILWRYIRGIGQMVNQKKEKQYLSLPFFFINEYFSGNGVAWNF